MFSMPSDLMETMTEIFEVERNGKIICNVHGFFCNGKKLTQFRLWKTKRSVPTTG